MKTNYFIDVYEQLADNTWKQVDTVETQYGHYGVINGRVHVMMDGESIGECAMTQQEAEERKHGRYFVITKQKRIVDYVIGTFDLCRFCVKKPTFEGRYVIRVQLVNTREPYYFVQEDGKDWRFCCSVCNGTDMQELRAGMDKVFKDGEYVFENDQERNKFESLF